MVSWYHYEQAMTINEKLKGRDVIIWGISVSALEAYRLLKKDGIRVMGFTDSYTTGGTKFADLPVYSVEELKHMEKLVLFISTHVNKYKREILQKINAELRNAEIYTYGTVYGAGKYDIEHLKQLEENARDKINFVRDNLKDEFSIETYDKLLEYRISNDTTLLEEVFEKKHKQYFPESEILKHDKGEIFIDAGALNGATSFEFVKWANGEYEKIYALEPDPMMYEITKEFLRLKEVQNVEVLKKGAFSSSGEMSFVELNDTGSSHICDEGTITIDTVSIDEMLDGQDATFIKMDIEGAEMEALIGAVKTIERCRPKLAISIYHKEDDIWEIPYYIKKKYPWYQLYIRHYTDITTETILYATI